MSWAKIASDAIRQMWIPHPKYRQAESDAFAALVTADPGEVICIVGPSRVGKSSLVTRISESLMGGSMSSEDRMPLVSLVLENNSTHGLLSSKSFTIAALQAVRHPMFGLDKPDDLWSLERMHRVERTPEGVLRTAFENALRYRGTKYLVVDEAHHFLYARGGLPAAAALLDSLKCLAASTGVVLILVGAYPLLDLLFHLPHLIGRKLQTHLPRYRADNRDDVVNFDRILIEYSKPLRFEGALSLRTWNEYLHEGSHGCIGLLRGWIRDALNRAWLADVPVLSMEHFETTRKTPSDLQSLAAEIRLGEERLGYGVPAGASSPTSTTVPRKTVQTRERNKPFTANPRRFTVDERRDPHGK